MGADIDDAGGPAALGRLAQGGLGFGGQHERRDQVDVEHAPPDGRRGRLEVGMRDADRFAGIVDQHIESAMLLHDAGDKIARGGFIGQVGRMVTGARQLGRHRATGVGGPSSVQRHGIALARETTRDGGTDARGRAGDEGNAIRHRLSTPPASRRAVPRS
jgi:hypothetical protein